MGGAYCSAYGCLNSQLGNPEKSFFRFPREPEKIAEWLPLIGREDLLGPDKVFKRYKRVCCDHFDAQDYKLTKKLKKNRVPHLKLVNLTDLEEKRFVHETNVEQNPELRLEPKVELEPSTSSHDSDLFDTFYSHQVQETRKYNVVTQTTYEKQDKSTQTSTLEWHSSKEVPWTSSVATQVSFEPKNSRTPKKKPEEEPMPYIDNDIFLKLCEIFLNKSLADIAKCYLSKTSSGSRYTDEFKSLIRDIYLYSPRAYKLLQNSFNLPSIRTIQRIVSNSDDVNVKYSSCGKRKTRTLKTRNNEEIIDRSDVETKADIILGLCDVEMNTDFMIRNEGETSSDILIHKDDEDTSIGMVGGNEVVTNKINMVYGSETELITYSDMVNNNEVETSTRNIFNSSDLEIGTHFMVGSSEVKTCTDYMVGSGEAEIGTHFMVGSNEVETCNKLETCNSIMGRGIKMMTNKITSRNRVEKTTNNKTDRNGVKTGTYWMDSNWHLQYFDE